MILVNGMTAGEMTLPPRQKAKQNEVWRVR